MGGRRSGLQKASIQWSDGLSHQDEIALFGEYHAVGLGAGGRMTSGRGGCIPPGRVLALVGEINCHPPDGYGPPVPCRDRPVQSGEGMGVIASEDRGPGVRSIPYGKTSLL